MQKGPRWRDPHRFDGANERIRTADLRITSALLYQLSHIGKMQFRRTRRLIIAKASNLHKDFFQHRSSSCEGCVASAWLGGLTSVANRSLHSSAPVLRIHLCAACRCPHQLLRSPALPSPLASQLKPAPAAKLLVATLVDLASNHVANRLEHLHEDHAQHHGDNHNRRVPALIAVANGNGAQAAGANGTRHGRIAE